MYVDMDDMRLRVHELTQEHDALLAQGVPNGEANCVLFLMKAAQLYGKIEELKSWVNWKD